MTATDSCQRSEQESTVSPQEPKGDKSAGPPGWGGPAVQRREGTREVTVSTTAVTTVVSGCTASTSPPVPAPEGSGSGAASSQQATWTARGAYCGSFCCGRFVEGGAGGTSPWGAPSGGSGAFGAP